MPWTKDIVQDTGIIVGYWAIEKLFFDMANNKIEISYQGWISKAIKDAGNDPVVSESISLLAGDNPALASAVISYSEARVMAQIEFIGSTAV